jgi:hypothetical protein
MKQGKESSKVMRYTYSIAMAAAAVCLAGCATAPRVAVVEPVGPAPMLSAAGSGDGSLVVYSARVPAEVDVNRDEWLSNNDFGRNDFADEPAHTSYTVYTKSGDFVETIHNAHDATDPSPAVVGLAPGGYRVEAQAVNCDGTRITVILPVVIKSGELTEAHLDAGWRPEAYAANQVTKLPCGKVIGWRAPDGEFASAAKTHFN